MAVVYSLEFETWWAKTFAYSNYAPEYKRIAWLAWRAGREKMYEASAVERLQRVSC